MHPLHISIGSLLFLIAAIGVGLAALQGNHVWFSGLSLLAFLALLIFAVGASADMGHPRPTPPRAAGC
jgi:hypothetical protein